MPLNLQSPDLLNILIRVLVLFTAMPVHEFAHAAAAVRLGDDTPIRQGRYTLNPFAHLSLWGSLALLFLRFGWAKPVQVDMRAFRHPKRDMALVAAMGPLSNILLALAALVADKLLIGAVSPARAGFGIYMTHVILLAVTDINLLLAVFNLLPIPPLDGSKILAVVLPRHAYGTLMKYEGAVTVVLLLLLYTGYLFVPLDFLRTGLYGFLEWLTRPVDMLFRLG